MPFIECPSCDVTVELDEGASGIFDCPYCDEEFEFNPREDTSSPVVTLMIALFFLIYTAALIIAIFTVLEDSAWKQTEGEITAIGSLKGYHSSYDYSFEVDGETFNGSDGCDGDNEGSTNYCGGYEVGDAVMISYNPENPDQNEMVDAQLGSVLLGALILSGVAIGFVVLRFLRLRGRI